MMVLSDQTRRQIETLRQRYPSARSAVLPALWALQHQVGHLSVDGMREVADLLELAPSEVQAVSTFYSMYFQRPAGQHSAIVCANVSCALRGSDEIVSHFAKRLGCASGETSADGAFTWEATVECLGACGGAPAMQIDHHTYENLTPGRVDELLEQYRAGVGPDHGRAPAHVEPNRAAQPRARANPSPKAATASAESGEASVKPASSEPQPRPERKQQ